MCFDYGVCFDGVGLGVLSRALFYAAVGFLADFYPAVIDKMQKKDGALKGVATLIHPLG